MLNKNNLLLFVILSGLLIFAAVGCFGGGGGDYHVSFDYSPPDGGLASGGGNYDEGEKVTLEAYPNDGWEFVGWKEDGEIISDEKEYNFEIGQDRDFTVKFALETPAEIDPGEKNVEILIESEDLIEMKDLEVEDPDEDHVIWETFFTNIIWNGNREIKGVYLEHPEEDKINILEEEELAYVEDDELHIRYLLLFILDTEFDIEAFDLEIKFDHGVTRTLEVEFLIKYFLEVYPDPEDYGNTAGSGKYERGDEIILEAEPREGYKFVKWVDREGEVISRDPGYTYTLEEETLENRLQIKGVFEKITDSLVLMLLEEMEEQNQSISSTEFSPCGDYIVTGGLDKVARIWEYDTGEIHTEFVEHQAGIRSVNFSPCGNYVLSGSDDGKAKVWDVESGEIVTTVEHQSLSEAHFSPCGERILIAGFNGEIKLWNSETGEQVSSYQLPALMPLKTATFSPCGEYLVFGGIDETAKVVEAENGSLVTELSGHSQWITEARFSPCSEYIITASFDGTAKMWRKETGEKHTFTEQPKGFSDIDVSSCGEYVLTGSWDKTAKVWFEGEVVTDFTGHEHWVTSARFSPCGNYVVSVSSDHEVKVWKSDTGEVVRKLD